MINSVLLKVLFNVKCNCSSLYLLRSVFSMEKNLTETVSDGTDGFRVWCTK